MEIHDAKGSLKNLNPLYPLSFYPVYKSYIWGGQKIISLFHRTDAPEKVAESWEVTDRSDGMSIVADGHWQGLTLHELVGRLGEDLLGKGQEFTAFPLLIKLIDAQENLSIQVHPDDEKAKRMGVEAKAEAWFFLQTDKNASIYSGLKPHIDKAAFEEAIRKNAILETLEKYPIHPGDVIYNPGGRVHAILAGSLLLEVQQNSNTTYRIYDWERDRPMHIKEALQVIDWKDKTSAKIASQRLDKEEGLEIVLLIKTPYFSMQKIELHKAWKADTHGKSFQVLFVLEGRVRLAVGEWKEELKYGRSYLIPAACKEVHMTPLGTAKILRLTL